MARCLASADTSHDQQQAVAFGATTGLKTVLGRGKPQIKLVVDACIASAGDYITTDTEMKEPAGIFGQRSGWWEASSRGCGAVSALAQLPTIHVASMPL